MGGPHRRRAPPGPAQRTDSTGRVIDRFRDRPSGWCVSRSLLAVLRYFGPVRPRRGQGCGGRPTSVGAVRRSSRAGLLGFGRRGELRPGSPTAPTGSHLLSARGALGVPQDDPRAGRRLPSPRDSGRGRASRPDSGRADTGRASTAPHSRIVGPGRAMQGNRCMASRHPDHGPSDLQRQVPTTLAGVRDAGAGCALSGPQTTGQGQRPSVY